MTHETFELTDGDGIRIHGHRWLPAARPRAVIHILHGWAEHAGRYDRPAGALTAAGYAVYGDDHRGHGRTGADAGGLGDLGPGAMDGVVLAVHDVTDMIRAEWPGLPLFLLGHSWGSFLGQRFIAHWGDELAGVIFTGTTDLATRGLPGGNFNEPFEPARTPYDWLSRDESEVDRYVADPWCGFERMTATASAAPASRTLPPQDDGAIPRHLPVLILNGAEDPIGGEEGGGALADRYRSLGLDDVTFTAYPGARHELFNETNRDEVIGDVLSWLDRRAPAAPAR